MPKQNSFDKNIKKNNFEEIIPKIKYQKMKAYDLSLNDNKNSNYILLNENRRRKNY